MLLIWLRILSPFSVSKEVIDRSQRFEAVLPPGSIPEVRDSQATMANVIHLNEIVPLVQQLLLRNGMHFDNYQVSICLNKLNLYQTWMMTHNIFEVQLNAPRIVDAALVCNERLSEDEMAQIKSNLEPDKVAHSVHDKGKLIVKQFSTET